MNVQALANLVGIPYASGGRDRSQGLDCWGLIRVAALELFGTEVPDYTGYESSCDQAQTAPLFAARHVWTRISKGSEQPGDVLVLRLSGYPIHAGICLGGDKMLHTLVGRNSCIERYDSLTPWFRRIEGAYRWPTI